MNRLLLFSSLVICVATALLTQTSPQTAPAQYPFQNPDLPIEQRVDNILSLMTIDEKIEALDTNPSVPRLGIKGSGHVEGIHGLTQGGPGKWGRPLTVPTTTFPQGIGLGETWDPEVLRQAGQIEGYEARYVFQSPKYRQGGIVIRSPNADLGRDPRWGRNEECYGEDAFLNGTMVVAFSKGLQGDHPKYWQSAALMKHFLANSNENDRDKSSSNFDERLFHEYYALPFEMGVIEGGSRAYMAAYNAVNKVPMTINPVMQKITRDQWGQDGIICTDAGAMRNLVTAHKYYPDFETAAAETIKAGIGQFLDDYRDATRGALKRGLLTEADIDRALRGNYRVMIRLGLLDPPSLVPYSTIGQETTDPWLTEKHKAVALLATQKSIVLLKNSANLLPLDKKRLRSIAVIGPRANEVLLDWYSGTPPYAISPLEGIKSAVGPAVTVNYAANNDGDAAVKAARASDVAIVVVGNHPNGGFDNQWAKVSVPSEGREAVDRESIDMEQEALIETVLRANSKTIVVLKSSFPYAINYTQRVIPAILHMALNSQEEGRALASVLFGDYNPAGRLVQTWPRLLGQWPGIMDYDIRHGSTYMYFTGTPLYPFGYGLSYTTFSYRKLKLSARSLPAAGTIDVGVVLKNTGKRAGDEVVQLYVRHVDSAVSRPLKELKAFSRVHLRAGEQKTVTLSLPASRLAYWDADADRWTVERDQIEIIVGGSSNDPRLRTTIPVR
ncbi:MAG TPA: glycoside hydrolase family 3 C-terminal domain-containing protein [Pyrinomonadaceae bacterium]|nr:glycoside hydrolase family 3 C-terminal domain-containing protein [Pyrinomonadaceae bacterium]